MKKLEHGVYLCKDANGFDRAVREFTDIEVNIPYIPRNYPCMVILPIHQHSIIVREIPIDHLQARLVEFT